MPLSQSTRGGTADGTWQVRSGGSWEVNILGAFATILNRVLTHYYSSNACVKTLVLLDIISSVIFSSFVMQCYKGCFHTCSLVHLVRNQGNNWQILAFDMFKQTIIYKCISEPRLTYGNSLVGQFWWRSSCIISLTWTQHGEIMKNDSRSCCTLLNLTCIYFIPLWSWRAQEEIIDLEHY